MTASDPLGRHREINPFIIPSVRLEAGGMDGSRVRRGGQWSSGSIEREGQGQRDWWGVALWGGGGKETPQKKSCWEQRFSAPPGPFHLAGPSKPTAGHLPRSSHPHLASCPEPWTSWSYTMDPFPKAEVVAKQKSLSLHPSPTPHPSSSQLLI